jgi:hypothetical protein
MKPSEGRPPGADIKPSIAGQTTTFNHAALQKSS